MSTATGALGVAVADAVVSDTPAGLLGLEAPDDLTVFTLDRGVCSLRRNIAGMRMRR